jgi:hypothetical protein
MSHTPGPWFVDADGAQDAGTKGAFVPFDACGCCDSPWMCGETEKERAANARLIAAAPDLLAALELARPWMVYRANSDDLAVVDAAIKKAREG